MPTSPPSRPPHPGLMKLPTSRTDLWLLVE